MEKAHRLALTDPERLQALEDTELMDSPPEQRFDRLTKLVGHVLGVPVSLISLVDSERQYFKSAAGLELRETPLSHSFCQYVVSGERPLVISDARDDDMLRDNGAVRDFNVVAYLGMPLRTQSGEVVGSLCAIDAEARQWSDDEIDLLREFADIVASEIAAHQQLQASKRVTEALEASESRLRLALEAGGMGAWDWNLQTDNVSFSSSAYALWDMSAGNEVNAAEVFGRIHADDLARVETEIHAAMRDEAEFDSEFRIVLSAGGERWLAGRAAVVHSAEDEPVRMLGVNFDITEDKRREQQLENLVRERTAKLEALNRELEAFNYSVSHDLRAPLRGIDGFSQVLLEDYAEQLDEQARHYLQRVRAGAERMSKLIDDLLDLSRLSRSKLKLTDLNLTDMVRKIHDEIAYHHPSRHVELSLEQGVGAYGDQGLIGVALTNLLSNAWKFTAKREPARIAFGQSEDGVYFVRDNGAGFDMDYANKLFVAFQRLHDAEEFEGNGIGLATVQRIIHRHGGRLWAEGEVGKGATFYFTLPTAETRGTGVAGEHV